MKIEETIKSWCLNAGNDVTFPLIRVRYCYYLYNVQGGPKTGLFLRSDNFATTNDRKACNMSKVLEVCLE